jgi:hypothetical protein
MLPEIEGSLLGMFKRHQSLETSKRIENSPEVLKKVIFSI